MYNLPNVFPEWKIEKKIGIGSLGEVYRASRIIDGEKQQAVVKLISFPRDFAEIKKLKAQGRSLDEIKAQFRSRVNIFAEDLKGINELPNIVSVKDCKVVEAENDILWDIYILMDMSTPLSKALYSGKITEKVVAKLGVDICTALEVGTANDLVHRDIKPENIFVDKSGAFLLGDFALAQKFEKMGEEKFYSDVLNYTSPEVASEKEFDDKADIYSLGMVMYRLLNGNKLPFLSENSSGNANEREEALTRRFKGEALPAPSEASEEMAKIILKACAFDPKDRYENATSMKKALMESYKDILAGFSIADGTGVKIVTKSASGVAGGVVVNAGENVSQPKNRHLKTAEEVAKASENKAAAGGAVSQPDKKEVGAKSHLKPGTAGATASKANLDDTTTFDFGAPSKVQQQEPSSSAANSENKKKNMVPVIIIATLVAICAALLVVFLAFSGDGGDADGESSNETAEAISSSLDYSEEITDSSDVSEETNSSNTSEDTISNDITSDDTTSDDTTSEDATSEDTTSDDTTSGDTTSDDTTSEDTTSDDTTSEDTTSNDTSSEDTTSDDTTSEDATSDDTASDDTSSEDTTSDDTTSDDTTSDDTSSEDTSSEDTTSDDTTSDDTTSDDTSSDDTSSDDTTSEDTTSDDTTFDDTTSDDATSGDTTSDDPSSEETTSDDTTSKDYIAKLSENGDFSPKVIPVSLMLALAGTVVVVNRKREE